MIKKIAAVLLSVLMLITCAACSEKKITEDNGKLKIVSTVFPPYDFAKQIVGDNAELSILLPPGSDTHSFEPSPKDIISIENCDIFLYIGGVNEQWAEKILESCDKSKVKIVKLIDCVELIPEGISEDGNEEHHENDGHNHEYDQHIWTSPKNAKLMLSEIYKAIAEADKENESTYKANYEKYDSEITALQNDIKTAVDNANNKTVIFADKFPFRYFAEEFGLTCHAAFSSCSDESEPSAADVAKLIDIIKENKISTVYYLQFSNKKVADNICAETGATALPLHVCHNVSGDELAAGESYVSLMRNNLENLKKCLE